MSAQNLAGGGGFEPPLTGPEPVVLPLDDPPAAATTIIPRGCGRLARLVAVRHGLLREARGAVEAREDTLLAEHFDQLEQARPDRLPGEGHAHRMDHVLALHSEGRRRIPHRLLDPTDLERLDAGERVPQAAEHRDRRLPMELLAHRLRIVGDLIPEKE